MRSQPGSFLSLSPGGFHRIAYLEWGNPASDHVVVCVYGLARNSRDFDYLARDLASRCRVICVDVVGRGDSEWLADKGDYSFSTYLTDAAALIARISAAAPSTFGTFRVRRGATPIPKRIDWVGTSMGGLIGMLLAAKPGSPIRRLVLNDIGPFIPWSALYRLKGYVSGGSSFRSMAEVEAYLREACAQFGPLSDEQWRHLAEHSVVPVDQSAGAAAAYRLRYDPGIGDTMRGGRRDPESFRWVPTFSPASTCGPPGRRSAVRRWCCAAPNPTCSRTRRWSRCRHAGRASKCSSCPESATPRR